MKYKLILLTIIMIISIIGIPTIVEGTTQILSKTYSFTNFSNGMSYSQGCNITDTTVSPLSSGGCRFYTNPLNISSSLQLYKYSTIGTNVSSIFRVKEEPIIYHFSDNETLFELKFTNTSLIGTQGESPIYAINGTYTVTPFIKDTEYGALTFTSESCTLIYNRTNNFNEGKGTVMFYLRTNMQSIAFGGYIISTTKASPAWNGWDIYFSGNNFGARINNGSNQDFFPQGWYSKNSFQGGWNHFAFTWDNTTGIEAVYVDGELIFSNQTNFTVIRAENSEMSILKQANNFYGDCMNATIANLIILNKTIVQSELANNTNKWLGGGIPIMVFHNVNDTESTNNNTYGTTNDYSLNVSQFNQTMQWLYQNGYNTITFREYDSYLNGTFDLPVLPVIITFDDGYKSWITTVAPLMRELNYKGVAYVITSNLDNGSSYQVQAGMNWTDVQALQNVYGWEIGSHTTTHVNSNSDPSLFLSSLNQSYQAICGNLSLCPISFAYPNYVINDTANASVNVGKFYKYARGGSIAPYLFLTNESNYLKMNYAIEIRRGTYNFSIIPYQIKGTNSPSNPTYYSREPYTNVNKNFPIKVNSPLSTFEAHFYINGTLSGLNVLAKNNRTDIPYIYAVGKYITSLNSTYDDVTRTVNLSCSGTGNITVNNLNTLGTSYRVFHNGVLVTTTNTSSYTLTSCSEWLFVGNCAYLDSNYTFYYNVTNPTCFINNYTSNVNVTLVNYNLGYPFNDIKNTSTNTILSSNVDNYSISLSPNQQIEIGNMVHSGVCYKYGSNMSVAYYNSTPICINATGNIFVNYTGFTDTDLKDVTSDVVVRSGFSSLYYGMTSGRTYLTGDFPKVLTVPPASEGNVRKCVEVRDGSISALSELPTWIGLALLLLATAVIIGIVVSNMNNSRESNNFGSGFEVGDLITVVVPVVLTAIFIVIGIIILSNLC